MSRCIIIAALAISVISCHTLMSLSRPATLVIDKCNKLQVTT